MNLQEEVRREIIQFREFLEGEPDPAERMKLAVIFIDMFQDLIHACGSKGIRGEAAQEAVEKWGLEEAARRSDVSPATLNAVVHSYQRAEAARATA